MCPTPMGGGGARTQPEIPTGMSSEVEPCPHPQAYTLESAAVMLLGRERGSFAFAPEK